MAVLNILKKKWNKQDLTSIKFSFNQINEFIHSDSKSLVKKIYITSIIEFCFWFLANMYISYTSIDFMSQTLIGKTVEWLNLINYFVLIYFIFQFYDIKTKLSYSDNTKSFLFKILRLIRMGNNYIIYNMIIAVVSILLAGLNLLASNPNSFHSSTEKIVLGVSLLISIGFILTVLHFLYKFLYGRFLKKLQANYNELKNNFN